MKKIIFIGKGGVGKTTILSTLCRLLADEGHKVLVIDCDPSMNLAMSLGIPFSEILSLNENKSQLQEKLYTYLEESGATHENHDLSKALEAHMIEVSEGLNLLVMGTIPHGGSGCLCSPMAMVKMLVDRLSTDGDQEFIMVDSPAGVEILGRGLSLEFDLSLVITEPTPKSMDVARHSLTLASELGIKKQIVVANKIESGEEYDEVTNYIGQSEFKLYTIGFDRTVVDADKRGILLLDYAPESPAIKDISKIKDSLLEV
ncbi:MAG: AAA family ATPase [Methanotrichaceae archaeon]